MRFASRPFPTSLLLITSVLLGASFAAAQSPKADLQMPAVTMIEKPVTVIAVPTFGVSGNSGAIAPGAFPEIIYNDLEVLSDFQRAKNQSFVEETHRRDMTTNQVDFTEWQRLSANFVLKGEVSARGNTISADCLLYDVDNKRKVFGLRYADFPLKNPRKLAHRISDDVVKHVFDDVGIASTQIVYVSARTSAREKEIYVMDADGHNQRRVTSDRSLALTPCWGKNATEIYFTSYRDRYPDLCMVQLDSSKVWYISRRDGGNHTPDWCPKTQRIVCFLGKDGNPEIYSMDRSGVRGSLRRLTNDPAIDCSPCWSPDGSQVAFTSDRTGAIHIWKMNADGSNPVRLTHKGSYNDSPAWSPLGDRIAFEARDQGIFDIYTMNTDGSGLMQLTGGQGRNDDPSWAPDGKHLVFSSNRTGSQQIYIMRADGTNQRQITREGLRNESPSWSPPMP